MTTPHDGPSGDFHASLVEVEPGLFRAQYPGVLNPARRDGLAEEGKTIDQHTGTDREAVRAWVEELAHRMGYAQVVWEEPAAPRP